MTSATNIYTPRTTYRKLIDAKAELGLPEDSPHYLAVERSLERAVNLDDD